MPFSPASMPTLCCSHSCDPWSGIPGFLSQVLPESHVSSVAALVPPEDDRQCCGLLSGSFLAILSGLERAPVPGLSQQKRDVPSEPAGLPASQSQPRLRTTGINRCCWALARRELMLGPRALDCNGVCSLIFLLSDREASQSGKWGSSHSPPPARPEGCRKACLLTWGSLVGPQCCGPPWGGQCEGGSLPPGSLVDGKGSVWPEPGFP